MTHNARTHANPPSDGKLMFVSAAEEAVPEALAARDSLSRSRRGRKLVAWIAEAVLARWCCTFPERVSPRGESKGREEASRGREARGGVAVPSGSRICGISQGEKMRKPWGESGP